MEILERYDSTEVPTLQKTNDAVRWIGENVFDQKIGSGDMNKWLQIRTHTIGGPLRQTLTWQAPRYVILCK
jgi:hypothetical protein